MTQELDMDALDKVLCGPTQVDRFGLSIDEIVKRSISACLTHISSTLPEGAVSSKSDPLEDLAKPVVPESTLSRTCLPEGAVEAGARAICHQRGFDLDGPTCDIHVEGEPDAIYPWYGFLAEAQACLDAAVPVLMREREKLRKALEVYQERDDRLERREHGVADDDANVWDRGSLARIVLAKYADQPMGGSGDE